MPAPVDLYTADPDINSPETIEAELDKFVQESKTMVPQFNAAIVALNLNDTSSVSTTSMSISEASKSFTVETGKSYLPGMTLRIARTSDATKWMEGEVTSYTTGTGAIVVNVRRIYGTGGPFTDWTVTFAAAALAVGDHRVIARGGSGYASTRTMRRVFTTIEESTGTAVTYTNTAANGLEITVNEDGLYKFIYRDESGNSAQPFGIVVDNTEYTTGITSVTVTDIKSFSYCPSLNIPVQQTLVIRLASGSVVAPHTNGTATPGTSDRRVYFSAEKVGN